MHTPFVRDSVEAKVILVVDDYKPLRVLIQRILERQHYRVLCASNGEQAIITAREHPGKIDLLLTDLTLTGMQGLDLASMLLAERSEMKVAYMSGDPTAAAIRRLTASGDPAQFILQKPFYTDMLIEMVRGMIGDPDQYNQGPTNPPGSSMAQF